MTQKNDASPRNPSRRHAAAQRPVVLCILDGWALNPSEADNAVALADTPVMDRLTAACPHATLVTHSADVGLPEGQMGNSEVGHMNLGAGRVVMQDLPRIDATIAAGKLGEQPTLAKFIEALRESGGRAHLLGLLSPGGVHSHQAHMAALARVLTAAGIEVLVHAFLDGRDTPPKSALAYLERFAKDAPEARIATVSGRYFAMDRDNRWERVGKAAAAMIDAESPRVESAEAAVRRGYEAGETDEFVEPAVVGDYEGMRDGDGLIFANFRADRARQLLHVLIDPNHHEVERRKVAFAALAGMVSYSEALDPLIPAIFPPQSLTDTLGEVVARAGLTQLRVAETEKYPHVTFFFNGGREEVFQGEERLLVPSPKVATYDLKPEMSAPEVTEKLVEAVAGDRFDMIVVNYANGDMVGHSGDLQATIRAVETVDACVGRLVEAISKQGGCVLVTADHGNADMMRDPETGEPHTAHTLFPVPVILAGGPKDVTSLAEGRLADVAPTLLALLGLPQPTAMTGQSLLRGLADDTVSENGERVAGG